MINRFSAFLATTLIVIVASASSAETEGRSGPYVGIGPGIGFINISPSPGISLDPAYGFDIWFGHRIIPFVALETQLEYLNGFTRSGVPSVNNVAFTANVKAYPLASISDRIEPFVYVGVGLVYVELSGLDTTEFLPRFGGGVDLYVTDTVAFQISGSYALGTGAVDGVDYGSVVFGPQFSF